MSAASKTLELLEFFSPAQPEIGLTQLCRLAGRDKATTYRHLQALETAGFVEQNPLTRQYRLGPKLLQLAQTREITVPRKSSAEAPLRALADITGETTHVSILSGQSLFKLTSFESPQHSIRVIIDIDEFPLHATASGLCALAFGPERLLATAHKNMHAFTPETATQQSMLQELIDSARQSGFSRAMGSFEADVYSQAAPLFDQTGAFAGAVSVATVATRFTPELERLIQKNLRTASRQITQNWGGMVPNAIETAWAETLAQSEEMETVR